MTTTEGPPRHLHPVEPPHDPYDDTPPRTTPHDPAAERALIATALDHPNPAELRPLIEPGDFYNPTHETLWTAWFTLVDNHDDRPDAVLLNSTLIQAGDVNAVRALADVISTPATLALAPEYARVVRDHSRLRAIGTTAARLNQLARTGTPDNVEAVATEAYETLEHVLTNWGPIPGQPATPHTWAPVDLTQVLAGEHLDPPPTMLRRSDGIPLLYDGAVHTIAGESESGKTWLTLLAAVQLLDQGDRVVFVDFEDRADRVIARLCALGAHPNQIRDHFAYIRPDRPLDTEGQHQLAPALVGARLAILDGVTEAMTLHGYDLNSNADSALFQALLPRWIADHGPAVVMIDHVVKDKDKQDRFALGAQHKLAGIDGAAYMVKTIQAFGRGKRGLARVEVAKDRPGHVREHTFGKTIAEFTLDATTSDEILTAHLMPPGEASGRKGDTFEPTYLMEKISRYVQANPGMSKKAIEGAMNGRAGTIRLALELLVSRGYIGLKSGPRNSLQHHHIKPYYDTDPDTPDSTDQGSHDPSEPTPQPLETKD